MVHIRKSIGCAAILTLGAATFAPALAQDQSGTAVRTVTIEEEIARACGDEAAPYDGERRVYTGSRIPRRAGETPYPLAYVEGDELRAYGATSAGDAISGRRGPAPRQYSTEAAERREQLRRNCPREE